MKPISGDQLRSARNFLGWTQQDLADRLNTVVQTVAKWEASLYAMPKKRSLEITRLFQQHNLHFNEDIGIFKCAAHVEHYRGAEALKKLFNTMHLELSLSKSKEVYVIGLNDSNLIQYTEFGRNHFKDMAHLNPKMRIIKPSPELENLQSYAEYRTAPIPHTHPIYIYGHKVIMISWDPIEIISIDSYTHSHQFKTLFEYIWSTALAG
jgi:transcriptional regulator with XRE-family HTH domain